MKVGFFYQMIMDKIDNERQQKRKYIIRLLLERDNFICGICLRDIKDATICNIDHIIPKSKGGKHISSNLQVTHKECNFKKGSTIIPTLKSKPIVEKVDEILKGKYFVNPLYYTTQEQAIKEIEINIEKNKQSKTTYRALNDDNRDIIKPRQVLKSGSKKNKFTRLVFTEIIPSTAPKDLWNEVAANGLKNLSYERILEYFEAYKNHNPHKVIIKEHENCF